MEIVNDSSLAVAWVPGKVRYPEDSLTLVVKGRFKLVPGGIAAADEADPPLPTGDEFHDGDPEQSLRYDSDFAFFKPRADLMLVGTCYPPEGKPVPQCRVSFGVNRWVKSLNVIGDRYWAGLPAGRQATAPRPFSKMPLRYENAFGGADYTDNPLGKGVATIRDAQGQKTWPLPNIEYPAQAVRAPRDRPAPAGFGPISRTRPQRMAGMGTYNGAWEAERWPWFPKDFDWASFNAAPLDQQVQTYLDGDEQLFFENMHPAQAEYRCRLPGIRPRCLVIESEGETRNFREVALKLDTLWVDMDEEALVLVWRGLAPIRSPEHEELSHVYLTAEPLSEAPGSPEARVKKMLAQRDATSELGDTLPLDRPQITAVPPGAPAAAPKAELEAEIAPALAKIRESLLKAGVKPDQLDAIETMTDAGDIVRKLFPGLGDPVEAKARLEAERRQRQSQLFQKAGYDPAVMELFDNPESGAGIRSAVTGLRKFLAGQGQDTSVLDQLESAVQEDSAIEGETGQEAATAADTESGARFAGQDLSGHDLSGQDLSGESFAGADLSGTNLSGATLRGADFTDAVLTEADLTGADLEEANLTGATLARANLARAVLRGANMRTADATGAEAAEADFRNADMRAAAFAEAKLRNADMSGIAAQSLILSRADLSGAVFAQADLTGANLSGSALHGAKFDGACLANASLEGASGKELSMTGADLTGLRAGGGSAFPGGAFRQVRGEGSLWFEANLTGADFAFAELPRADFRAADLSGGKLAAADLKEGNLTKTQLRNADARSANFFRARLGNANLDGADFRQSNCYEAEFLNAVVRKTRFEGANLKMTKIASLGRKA